MKIFINGIDRSGKGIRESTKLLAQYLPDVTSNLVDSVIILGQGLPNRFSNNKPAQRKEILEKLTKSDFMIQSIKDKLEGRQEVLRTQLRGFEDKALETNSKISVYEKQKEAIGKQLEQCKQSSLRDISSLSSDIESIQSSIDKVNKFVENKQAIVDEYTTKKVQITNDYAENLHKNTDKVQDEINLLTAKDA